MTIHIVGRGIVASRLVRMLAGQPVTQHDPHWSEVTGAEAGDVVVLAHGGEHAPAVPELLARSLHDAKFPQYVALQQAAPQQAA